MFGADVTCVSRPPAMLKVWPGAQAWADGCHVSRQPQNKQYNGNDCATLIKKADALLSIAPIEVLPFVEALKAFRRVVASAFGCVLFDSFNVDISNFSTCIMDLQALNLLTITPKMHIVMHHVREWCEQSGEGLGIHSEQAGEAAHHTFKHHWERYVCSKTNPNYADRLKRAVLDFNCSHL